MVTLRAMLVQFQFTLDNDKEVHKVTRLIHNSDIHLLEGETCELKYECVIQNEKGNLKEKSNGEIH